MSSLSSLTRSAAFIGMFSAVVIGFLFYWIYFAVPASQAAQSWVSALPSLNALLNTLSAICLIIAVIAIKQKKVVIHQSFIYAALFFSALFLMSYLVYHHYQGDTKFMGSGLIRSFYFFILITHIVGSVLVVPMILWTVFLAWKKRFDLHPKWARWTFPIWLYVSITGVAVYFLLRFYG